MISRRRFVALSGTVLFATRFAYSSDETPPMLDHILLGSNDLDDGIAFVEKQTGVRAAFGGVHPGMGTRNALLSLGVRRYLEVIAPDPKQENVDAQRLNSLKKLKAPKLVGWAAHLGNADEFVKRVSGSRNWNRRAVSGLACTSGWASAEVEDGGFER
jgi:hypothetical protein